MTVRELLTEVAFILEGEELSAEVSSVENAENSNYADKIKNLLMAFNRIQSEVAINFIAPISEVEFTKSEEQIYELCPRLKRIISVIDGSGKATGYKIEGDRFKANARKGVVRYEYIPEDCDLDGEFIYDGKLIGKRAFIYGTCAEYCLCSARYDEAVNWENRYRQATEVRSSYSSKRIKAGRTWGL